MVPRLSVTGNASPGQTGVLGRHTGSRSSRLFHGYSVRATPPVDQKGAGDYGKENYLLLGPLTSHLFITVEERSLPPGPSSLK